MNILNVQLCSRTCTSDAIIQVLSPLLSLNPSFCVILQLRVTESEDTTVRCSVSGDRKYRVPALDPLEIKELKIADSGPRQAGLTLIMTNAKVYGVKDSQLEKTE